MNYTTFSELSDVITEKESNLPTDYLTESMLGDFLRERFAQYIVIHNKKVPNCHPTWRPDYRIEELKLIVEYDGPRHYTQSKVILRDIQKDSLFRQMGYDVIRIPYFIQLSYDMVERIFGKYLTDELAAPYNDFPLGFITDTVVLPADFCELGIVRFLDDLDIMGEDIRTAVLDSLYKKAKNQDIDTVLPSLVLKIVNESGDFTWGL